MSVEWQKRYFVLSGAWLLYWHTSDDFTAFMEGRDPEEPEGLGHLASLTASSSEGGLSTVSLGSSKSVRAQAARARTRADWRQSHRPHPTSRARF